MDRPEGVNDAIAAIWERNKARVAERLDTIAAGLDELAAGGDADLVARAHREAHNLAGSLGTFGYPEGSELARELERTLERDHLSPDDAAGAHATASRLRDVLALPAP